MSRVVAMVLSAVVVMFIGCGQPSPANPMAQKVGTHRAATTPTAASGMASPVTAPAVIVIAPPAAASADTAADATANTAADAAASPPAAAAPRGRTYTVDAMVGQVNGESIYAAEVLEPLDAQLRALRQNLPSQQFIEQTARLVRAQLEQIVLDRLLLAQAESELTADERHRMRFILNDIRAELVRRHGRGSEQLADATLREKTGYGLDQTLRRERQKLLIGTYQQRHLVPRIDVSRADVEREYRAARDVYQPQPARKVRMILLQEDALVKEVQRRIADGQRFEQIAADETVNLYRPAQAGLFAEALTDTQVFGEAALNEALAELEAGQTAGPLPMADGRQVWLHVESVHQAEARSLQDAQLEIERRLRDRQVQTLTMEQRRRLLLEGSYDPISQMAAQVMQVARDRYLVAAR
jgi:hypothetical protein